MKVILESTSEEENTSDIWAILKKEFNESDEKVKELCIATAKSLNTDFSNYFMLLQNYMAKRKELNLSQEKVSEISGISRLKVKRIEEMMIAASYIDLIKLLSTVGIKITVINDDNKNK